MLSIIEINLAGVWVNAFELEPMANATGIHCGYLPEYVFADPAPPPISLTRPLSLEQLHGQLPSFLYDIVPQGRGRQYLAALLNVNPESPAQDLFLAQHGAFNGIGNLRLNTAVSFYELQSAGALQGGSGFSFAEVTTRQEEFLDHLSMHAMLSAGTTGVQGVAPKFLLTQAEDDSWHADAALPDTRARMHWLIKLPRGNTEDDRLVLRNEAAYLRTAAKCKLRVYGEPMFARNMLFVPRFDRQVDAHGVTRLHQETLASVAGIIGFGAPVSQFTLWNAFLPHATDPARETIEFLCRDILNLAMRNTDNHARNTSVQRLPDGTIQLCPLYDFAPMYKDPEMIPRACKWQSVDQGVINDWSEILMRLDLPDRARDQVVSGLLAFGEHLDSLDRYMQEMGVDTAVIADCRGSIDTQKVRLNQLAKANHG